jgi:putative redox protein|tara:strand:+ start:5115 stop:5522 length:408 start_codon:yes stop_codon:yes gene_type:complete
MSHSIETYYVGNLRTSSTHIQSGDKIITDAPTDNNGKGEAFSPTDLVASALCSCMTTVMGICADKGNFNIPKSSAKVTKIMSAEPRKISEIVVRFTFEKSNLSETQKKKLMSVAENCPVAKSINPDIKQTVSFDF